MLTKYLGVVLVCVCLIVFVLLLCDVVCLNMWCDCMLDINNTVDCFVCGVLSVFVVFVMLVFLTVVMMVFVCVVVVCCVV